MSIPYRTLRAVKALPIKEKTSVTVSAHHEIEWDASNNGVRIAKRTLVVAGTLLDKAQAYAAEWRFPVSEDEFKQIGDGLHELMEAVRMPAGVFEPRWNANSETTCFRGFVSALFSHRADTPVTLNSGKMGKPSAR